MTERGPRGQRGPHEFNAIVNAPGPILKFAILILREGTMRYILSLTTAAALAALLTGTGPQDAAAQTRTTLDIYVVDVEGGNATLFVPPSGESVLIDSGNVAPAAAIRDSERIMAGAKG